MEVNATLGSALLLMLLAYLIGSVNSAILVCRAFKLGDPRQQGSGNPGATNVLRLGGRGAALITLLGDVGKGALPTWLALTQHFAAEAVALVALAAVLGHLYPVFFQFQGGKGVATTFGALILIELSLALSLLVLWLSANRIFHRSAAGALCAALATPALSYWLSPDYWQIFSLLSLIVIWRHRSNIRRWLAQAD